MAESGWVFLMRNLKVLVVTREIGTNRKARVLSPLVHWSKNESLRPSKAKRKRRFREKGARSQVLFGHMQASQIKEFWTWRRLVAPGVKQIQGFSTDLNADFTQTWENAKHHWIKVTMPKPHLRAALFSGNGRFVIKSRNETEDFENRKENRFTEILGKSSFQSVCLLVAERDVGGRHGVDTSGGGATVHALRHLGARQACARRTVERAEPRLIHHPVRR